MSSLPTSNALVLSTGGSAQAFAQQGSLDWVALGKAQCSFSIAVLGRLAKAGIDTLTVAFGQATCLKLQIGVHGERVLAESMGKLTAKSIAADLIWFGVGVRHILRELVQTSSGCSLVALCAALTEGHSTNVSSLVLYEIARECGGPHELTPSVEQWGALVRVAASIFNSSTFGLRVHQIARCGLPAEGNLWEPNNSHPQDLAKVLLSIGQITQGDLQTITVEGGCCCSWVAAWADYVLGLRVLVRNAPGDLVYANYDPKESIAQVNIIFVEDSTNNQLHCVHSSHVMRSGGEFIRQCFPEGTRSNDFFSAGRLRWETMFFDVFGDSFAILAKQTPGQSSPSQPFQLIRAQSEPLTPLAPFTENQIFCRLLAIAVMVMVAGDVTKIDSGSSTAYFLRACETFPELWPCKEQILSAMTYYWTFYGPEFSWLDSTITERDSSVINNMVSSEYAKYRSMLGRCCTCLSHRQSFETNSAYCLVQLTETIIYTISLFDRVVFDKSLRPTCFGICRLFQQHHSRFQPFVPSSRREPFLNDSAAFVKTLNRGLDERCNTPFRPLAAIFSGQDWSGDPSRILAESDGKLYLYVQILEEFTDNIRKASQIHIGSGSIEYRTRLYSALYDEYPDIELRYRARPAETVESIDFLSHDSSSGSITAQVVIIEKPTRLCLQHRITSEYGEAAVTLGRFLVLLTEALSYRIYERLPVCEETRWSAVWRGGPYALIQGEGAATRSRTCHTLRPLRGNVLGRCVTIWKATGKKALVRTDEELQLFARYWIKHCERRFLKCKAPKYFMLVS